MVKINHDMEAAARDRVRLAQCRLTTAQAKVDAFEPQGPWPSSNYLEAMRDAWQALVEYAEARVALDKTLRWKALLSQSE